MRPSLALLVILLGSAASAQTGGRVAFLSRSLSHASDPRLRAQAALLLGATQDSSAVEPLCGALGQDTEPLVRSAAARSLETLKELGGIPCLEAASQRESGDTAAAIQRALAELIAARDRKPELYFALAPVVDRSGALGPDVLHLTEERLRSKLQSIGGMLAPASEAPAAAKSVLRARKLRGYYLRIELAEVPGGGINMNVVCFTYPDRSLLGEVDVKASGAKPVDLVRALAPKAVDEAAQTFNWSS